MGKIYIVQHCQSEHIIDGQTGGWTDSSLTEKGIKQAKACANELFILGGLDGVKVLSSDLKRARCTAIIISTTLNGHLTCHEELREMNNGLAANKTLKWAKENMLVDNNALYIDKPRWEGAETPRDLYQRMESFYNNHLKDLEEDIVVVSHGIAISYLVSIYLGFTLEELKNSSMMGSPGGITVLQKSFLNQNQLKHFNHIGHLV